MDRQIIHKRAEEILREIEKLTSTIRAMSRTDIEKNLGNFETLSTDAALRAELVTCRLRHLIYSSTNIKKQEYLASAGVVQGIEIHNKDGILEIILPCLLPKRKQRQSTEFLIDPIYFTLSSYAVSHKLPYFVYCVVCFSHVYNRELPLRRIRDYDNLELKQILDVVSTFVMKDDNGILCDAYNTTEIGESDCTRITIMDTEHFPRWLEERKNNLKTISDFCSSFEENSR